LTEKAHEGDAERGTAREDTGDRERTYERAIDSERSRVRIQKRMITRANEREQANTHTLTHTRY
jgi:hypothetical protein